MPGGKITLANGTRGGGGRRKMVRKESQSGDQYYTDDSMAYERVSESANFLMRHTQHRPKIAIICGSGLAGLADLMTDVDSFPYGDIPNFPESTVPGHKSRMLFGTLKGVEVMLMQGRFHAYEGYPLAKVAMPVRVMKLCGIETLIVTNAAGGLNADYKVGDVMVIKDHINIPGFTGLHPLKGPNDQRFGTRFFALNDCYDKRYRQLAHEHARDMGVEHRIHHGVYAMLGGPNFETVAELKMLRICGVDAVGMSTIPETLVAAHCGVRVFAFSLVTNECILEEDSEEKANHEEVIATANQQKELLMDFVGRMVDSIDKVDEECRKNNGAAASNGSPPS